MSTRKIKIRRTHDLELVRALDLLVCPLDDPADLAGAWWIAWVDGRPAGYGGARIWEPDNCVFLSRSGVLPIYRGLGIQRRLIRARCNWGRVQGCEGVYTYTLTHNHPSMNNLIAEHFRPYPLNLGPITTSVTLYRPYHR